MTISCRPHVHAFEMDASAHHSINCRSSPTMWERAVSAPHDRARGQDICDPAARFSRRIRSGPASSPDQEVVLTPKCDLPAASGRSRTPRQMIVAHRAVLCRRTSAVTQGRQTQHRPSAVGAVSALVGKGLCLLRLTGSQTLSDRRPISPISRQPRARPARHLTSLRSFSCMSAGNLRLGSFPIERVMMSMLCAPSSIERASCCRQYIAPHVH